MDAGTLLIVIGVALLIYLYMKEKKEHTQTKNELAVLKRMGELSDLGKTLQNDLDEYNQSMADFDATLIPDHMLDSVIADHLPSGEVSETTPAGPTRFFKGQATEDIREGQSVEIEVREDLGKTTVKGATPTTRISPIGES